MEQIFDNHACQKKIIILILSSFLFTGCATVSEKANSAYDYVAGGVSKGYNKVKDVVTGGDDKE